ncbi:MAG TPA: hypothetical protein VFT37_11500 [Telluria sp.]|nr:hypothetical protein [Telluria sp.]
MTASVVSNGEGRQGGALLLGVRKLALALACAVAAWILFHPHPRGLAVAVAVAVPFVLCVVVVVEAAHGFRSERFRPVIGAGVVSATLAMRALFDVALAEYEALVVPALAGGLALALVLNRSLRTAGWDTLALITLLMALHCAGALALANVMLDDAAPERLLATVESKEARSGKMGGRFVTLAGGRASVVIRRRRLAVDAVLYASVDKGDTLCVDVGRGAFGLTWYALEACAPG